MTTQILISSSVDERSGSFSIRNPRPDCDSSTRDSINSGSGHFPLYQLSSSITRTQRDKTTQAFDVAKLQFDAIGLVGRQREIAILADSFDRLLKSNQEAGDTNDSRQVILLKGESGTGKTALARTLEKATKKRGKGHFVSTKCDHKFKENTPFSGISGVCNGMVQSLLEKSDFQVDILQDELSQNLDPDHLDLLEPMIPLLHELRTNRREGEKIEPVKNFPGPKATTVKVSSVVQPHSEPKANMSILTLALRRIIRILISALGPVVVFLDDLQWSDQRSLELLKYILEDDGIQQLMIIGCYRSDEVDKTHCCRRTIQNLYEAVRLKRKFALKEITVENLPLEPTDYYIRELLNVSDSRKTQGLSSICYKRTLGNVFFLRVFLTSLYDAGLIQFNFNLLQWIWDEKRIELETAATENVVNLLKSKMNEFSDHLLLLLKITSCLGNKFRRSTIEPLWNSLQVNTDVLLEDTIRVAIEEMFIEIYEEGFYRFVHDKVQEAASELIPAEEFSIFQKRIGMCLYRELYDDEWGSNVFVVADLLNNDSKYSPEAAGLNLAAARKAMELSAFQSASRYVECGLQNLTDIEIWDGKRVLWDGQNFNLALQLHTIGAEAEACLGNIEKAEDYCTAVMAQENATPIDKTRAYKVMIEQMHQLTRHEESFVLCLQMLRELGNDYPKSRVHQQLKAMMYMRQIKKRYLPKKEEIDQMSFAADPKVRETVRMMVVALPSIMAMEEKSIYVLTCCQGVRLTKRHGLTEFTGSLFASFANVLMHRYGDWATAKDVAEAALAIQFRLDSNYTRTSTLSKASFTVLGWVKPLKVVWSNLVEVYRIGMLSGNIDGAAYGMFTALLCHFFSGTSLKSVKDDLEIYTPQVEALKIQSVVLHMHGLWQVVLDLIHGRSGRVGDLDYGVSPSSSDLMVNLTDVSDFSDTNHPPVMKKFFHSWICYRCVYLGDYEIGAEIALKEQDSLYKSIAGFSFFGFFTFPRAFCLYARARATGQRRLWQNARKVRQVLRLWVRNGGVNFLHQLFLLDAEDAVLRGDAVAASKAYSAAITTAARSGFVQDAGLANERYADFLVSLQDGTADVDYHYREAIKYYSEWGSSGNVASVRQKRLALDET